MDEEIGPKNKIRERTNVLTEWFAEMGKEVDVMGYREDMVKEAYL